MIETDTYIRIPFLNDIYNSYNAFFIYDLESNSIKLAGFEKTVKK